MCLAFVTACAACAHHAEPAVQVRLARDGEFPPQLASPLGPWEDCRIEGENDQRLYGPAIAYVREKFEASFRRSREELPRIAIRFEGDDRPLEHGDFAVIHVDPKNKVGRLSVATSYDRETYCVHVLTERGQTVLALAWLTYAAY